MSHSPFRKPTREEWLNRAAEAMRPWFTEHEVEVPETLWISVAEPSGGQRRVLGRCWPQQRSEDGGTQIYIMGDRGADQTVDVLATLCHELQHAALDCADGHQGAFARLNKAMGFTGKPTSSAERQDWHEARLAELAEKLGDFPHPKLDVSKADAKVQKTYMVKLTCMDPECGYQVRTTKKWIDVGLPVCPCGEALEPQA